MQISILQGSASRTAVYTETQTPTTNANGFVPSFRELYYVEERLYKSGLLKDTIESHFGY
jgi:hypothetical protein